jgi:serine/threonine protein kinase
LTFREQNSGSMELTAGTRLGQYEILAPIGRGGMGEVYRARDTKLNRDVAIKILPPAWSLDLERRARFEREAQAVASLSHPSILAIHEFGEASGITYAVMELLRGESLRDRLASGPLPVRKAVDYGIQIAAGLAAAHDRGIIHRDLKPENVFVLDDGHVKILDFGLARQLLSQASLAETRATAGTAAGLVLGTVGYMAPEQVRGETADQRADVFAFAWCSTRC